jgi:hypothetical protein
MTRTHSCPACGLAWPSPRIVCPRCLVELIDDPSATVRCRHCRRLSPAYKQSCPNCLAELHPNPADVLDSVAAMLAQGRHLPRPDSVPAFAQSGDCTLLRLVPGGGLALVGDVGWIEAHVVGRDHNARPPLSCLDLDGSTLFRLERYGAADNAVVAFDGAGAPIATFLQGPGVFDRSLDVRDETTAPVARLRPAPHGEAAFELVETGGEVLARCEGEDVEHDGWVDDEWTLREVADRNPVSRLALVALTLAAKVLLGRTAPVELVRRSG